MDTAIESGNLSPRRDHVWLVFLYGPPAVGKLTVARELQALTQYRVFHNHLVVDLVQSVFEFGSPPFIALREQLWLATLHAAARQRVSLIFTFAPERTVQASFPADAEAAVTQEGGRVLFVALRCAEQEIERRLAAPSRAPFNKLRSRDQYRALRDGGAFAFPPLRADLAIDTGALSARAAAETISAALTSV